MIEASKITGVKAYHLSKTTSDSIYDFGFSKSPEETLEKWGEEETYRRLIKFIRTYQPDVVMPSFRNVDSQHGHHRAMTILSGRAFEDAADPSVFPEQLEEGLSTWQVKKLYLPAESEATATTSLEIGDYDPIYGMSYPQLGEKSRYLHKSQGMGNDIPVEPRQYHLELWKENVDTKRDELFAGIPYDFEEWADKVSDESISSHLKKLQKDLNRIVDLYPDREAILAPSQKTLRDVRKISDKLDKSKLSEKLKNVLQQKLELKEEQLQQVSFITSSLYMETEVNSQVMTKSENISVQTKITNNGEQAIKHINAGLKAPEDWNFTEEQTIKKLTPGESISVMFNGTVPDDADYTRPYDEPLIQSSLTFKENGEKTTKVSDLGKTIAVMPELSVSTNPKNIIVNTAEVQDEITVDVNVRNYANESNQASISLDLPEGWESNKEPVTVSLNSRG